MFDGVGFVVRFCSALVERDMLGRDLHSSIKAYLTEVIYLGGHVDPEVLAIPVGVLVRHYVCFRQELRQARKLTGSSAAATGAAASGDPATTTWSWTSSELHEGSQAPFLEDELNISVQNESRRS